MQDCQSERRDAAFEDKMAEVLCVYREVAILKRLQHSPAPPGLALRRKYLSRPFVLDPFGEEV